VHAARFWQTYQTQISNVTAQAVVVDKAIFLVAFYRSKVRGCKVEQLEAAFRIALNLDFFLKSSAKPTQKLLRRLR
jgi:hypothetical protein